ncbi:MAG TPA: aspartyl protease family protein [Steroidobacteraceae bacterium]|nr:aspartyl protease family protein [Steroidobacteraceae bacterium]
MKLGFPSPLLQATVSGQQVWFIIDTGAGVHTFASWFVSAAGIGSRQTNGSVTGSTGATESRLTKAEGTTLQLDDDRKLTLREAIVVDLPSIFAEQRIAGLLSPQLLAAPHTAAVLDLRVPRLRFEPFGTAVGSLGRKHVMILTGVRACRNAQSPFANRQYAAVIKVDGIDGTMLVDSGATGTVAFPESQIASKLASRASETNRTQGVGGTVQTTRKVHGVRLERGGTAATSDLIIGGAAGSCGSDGLLGMDALRQCVLVLGDRFAWFCDATSK